MSGLKGRDTIYHSGGRRGDSIHETPDVSYIKNPDVAHEETDVSVGPIAKFVVGLFVFATVICLLMFMLFRYFEQRAKENELPASPVARQGEDRLPPEPRLQGAPGFRVNERSDVLSAEERNLELQEPQAEMRRVRKIWDHDLANYGLVEGQPGRVRIPIKDAMKIYLEREASKAQPSQNNQPESQPGQSSRSAPSGRQETMPSSSSSGKQLEKREQ
ncbi:MAG: hypothetical protein M3R15_26220 [Acidobacteriota bacterium]|nr:hypothetical protein [Acidobacteriota bacterium]